MANANDSFIDEVAEAVRRDRISQWFRRWGWAILALVLAIVGAAALVEWRQSQARADAAQRGEAILAALETEDSSARAAALADLPRDGQDGAVAAFLVAAEQMQAQDPEGAAATLNAVAADGAVDPLWRDLAALKAQMALGDGADPAALEALAAPGAPFGALAREQLALLHLRQGREDEGVALLQAILEDAETGASQSSRVGALLAALGHPAEAAPAPEPVPGE